MQSVLGGSLHKNNTSYLLLGLYHASVNKISIALMQITPQDERYYGICASSEYPFHDTWICETTWKATSLLHHLYMPKPYVCSLAFSVIGYYHIFS